MSVVGIFLKGNRAHIVTLEGTKKEHHFVDEEFKVLEFEKNPTQKDVAAALKKLQSHIDAHGVKKIILNRRITAGQMAGAAGTFLWEGVLLAASPLPLTFVHAATLRSTAKKHGDLKHSIPEELLGKTKAYDFAFEGLK
ncbi:MAG: DUF3010 family protein [Deltaproteobacteria bacterium]|nr:DUF3010 family protein [Deltaproteobacteria bacterium]MBN2672347.1 DUF3010 family protein [Deltaproteobacteria bacterium]